MRFFHVSLLLDALCDAQKMAPDLRRKVDAARAQRLAAETAVQKQTGLQVCLVVEWTIALYRMLI